MMGNMNQHFDRSELKIILKRITKMNTFKMSNQKCQYKQFYFVTELTDASHLSFG